MILLCILLQLLFNFPVWPLQYHQMSTNIFDVTEPINLLVTGNISNEEFVSSLKKDVADEGTPQKDFLSVVGLYDSGSSVFDSCCWDEIRNVILMVRNATEKQMDFTLIVSLKFDINNKTFDHGKPKILKPNVPDKSVLLFQLPEKVNCEELGDTEDLIYLADLFVSGTKGNEAEIGIGYPDTLIGCSRLLNLIIVAQFKVTQINFGKTPDVPESYGIFKRHMNALHEKNLKFIKQSPFRLGNGEVPELIYLPLTDTAKDSFHRDLLMKYSNSWLQEVSNDGVAVKGFVIPYLKPENDSVELEYNKFCVVPYIRPANAWLTPAAMVAIRNHFDVILLKFGQRHQFFIQEKMTATYELVLKKPGIDSQLGLILDYSKQETYEWDAEKWEKEELMINKRAINATYPLSTVILKALVFNVVNTKTTEGNYYRAVVDTQVAHRMSQNYEIGCKYFDNSFKWTVVDEKVSKIVQACKTINGSFYFFDAGKFRTQKIETLNYTNILRPYLEDVKRFRNQLLLEHPDATVYMEIELYTEFSANKNNTVFCDDDVLQLNEYYEGILNWAKFNQFPIIIKSANEDLQNPVATSWLSYLRPLGITELAQSIFPHFVMRNYPKDINYKKWKVDPCIDWTHDRPDILLSYFHNNILGAIFHVEDDRSTHNENHQHQHNRTNEEYHIMFQFIFYKFQLVEVVVGNSWHEFSEICNTLEYNSVPYPSLFLNFYFFPKYINESGSVQSVLKLMNEIEEEKFSNVKGVHFDLRNVELSEFIDDNVIDENTRQWKMFLLSRKYFRDVSRLKTGILLNSSYCSEVYLTLALTTTPSSYTIVMNTTNYVVCNEKLSLLTLNGDDDGMKNLGQVFDTHLYIKKGFQDVMPHLDVYFRVEINVLLDNDPVTMNRYLRLLSHFKKFGRAYNISYFMVESFDGAVKNGWWAFKNYTDLANGNTYVEKESVYSGRQMWYPPLPARNESSHSPTIKSEINYRRTSEVIVISVSSAVGILILAGIIFGIIILRYRSVCKFLTHEEVQEFLKGRSRLVQDSDLVDESDTVNVAEGLEFSTEYDLSILDLNIDTKTILGFGNFGTVYKGTVKGTAAAIKRPNNNCAKSTFKSFLCEVKILCHISLHPNVVGFLGAYIKEIDKGILYIATEFCANGSLDKFLKAFKHSFPISDPEEGIPLEVFPHLYDLHRFAREIAEGMEYIASKRVVHGDLSARNVFIDENKICKIGDFGLSRKLCEYEKYVKESEEALPWKWMAYETLACKEFTLKSDVWSYGVTVWEIYSLGNVPYGGLAYSTSFADDLRNGLRLMAPQFASQDIYKHMQDCWVLEPRERTSFSNLAEFFRSLCIDEYTVI